MKLSVIPIIHNEEATMAKRVNQVEPVLPQKALVSVDNASTDGTAMILRWRKHFALRAVNANRCGLGF